MPLTNYQKSQRSQRRKLQDKSFLGEFAHHAGLALHHGFIASVYLLGMIGLALFCYGTVNLVLSLVGG